MESEREGIELPLNVMVAWVGLTADILLGSEGIEEDCLWRTNISFPI